MNDLISRAAAIEAVTIADRNCLGAHGAREAIRALPAASQPEAEPVAWAEVFKGGKIASIRLARDEYRTVPLYTHPTPAPVVPAEGLREATMAVQQAFAFARDARPAGYEAAIVKIEGLLEGALLALRAQQPAAPVSGVTAQDDASAFDRADWFWRTMDPDDCGDNPAEAINRAMVGQFCVCEIASGYNGPTRYGFVAPVLDPESDDEEFIHFATQQEAIDAIAARRAALSALEGK